MPPPIVPQLSLDLLCGHCGYNLRGTPSTRCPECGQPFDPTHLLSSRLPWEQRRHLKPFGRLRTYLRTVRLITFHPRQAADFLSTPLDLPSARRFRLITVALAAAPLIGAGLLARDTILNYYQLWYYRRPPLVFLPAFVALQSLSLSLVSLLLSLFLCTMIATAFFCPRSLADSPRQRAFALGHYSCASLAVLLPLAVAISVGPWLLNSDFPRDGSAASDVSPLLQHVSILFLPLALAVGAWWLSTLVLLRHALRYSITHLLRIGILIAALQALATVALLLLLHLAVSFVVLLILSFR